MPCMSCTPLFHSVISSHYSRSGIDSVRFRGVLWSNASYAKPIAGSECWRLHCIAFHSLSNHLYSFDTWIHWGSGSGAHCQQIKHYMIDRSARASLWLTMAVCMSIAEWLREVERGSLRPRVVDSAESASVCLSLAQSVLSLLSVPSLHSWIGEHHCSWCCHQCSQRYQKEIRAQKYWCDRRDVRRAATEHRLWWLLSNTLLCINRLTNSHLKQCQSCESGRALPSFLSHVSLSSNVSSFLN